MCLRVLTLSPLGQTVIETYVDMSQRIYYLDMDVLGS